MRPAGHSSLLGYIKFKITMLRGPSLALTNRRRYLLAPSMLSKVLIILRSFIRTFAINQKTHMAEEAVTRENKRLGFELCRDSIGGVWAEIAEDELQIKPLSGGLTNELFICSIPPHLDVPDNQPRSVLLRIYGEIMTSCDMVVRNSVIFALMSEKRMGPRLYGMNPQARIEELLPSKPLATAQLSSPTLSRIIAKKLAQFHTLDMPLCKEPKFLFEQMDQWMNKVKEILQRSQSHKDQHLVKFKSYNLENELKVLKEILSKIESKVVFCHNDLQEGNILMEENCNNKEDALTVIDWEYCAYNYRGFDFGNHFCEWTCDYSITEEPYYSFLPENYPTPEQQKIFFRSYLSELSEEITEEKLDNMCVEADTFSLASHFFWALWSIIQDDTSNISFGFKEYAESRLQGYFEMKDKLQMTG